MAGVTDIEPRTRTENLRTWKRERRYYRLVLCLALDTSTPGGSCAVTRDGAVIRASAGDRGGPHGSAGAAAVGGERRRARGFVNRWAIGNVRPIRGCLVI